MSNQCHTHSVISETSLSWQLTALLLTTTELTRTKRENIIGYICGTQYRKEQFLLSYWQSPQFMCCPLAGRDASHSR